MEWTQNQLYALERQQHERTYYYQSRTNWTTALTYAKLFTSQTSAKIHIDLLPDNIDPKTITIRTITLTPNKYDY